MSKNLIDRLNFGKIPKLIDVPYLVEFQIKSFERFLQKDVDPDKRLDIGLQSALKNIFPIIDNNELISMEFVSYSISDSKMTPRECILKGITYTMFLKLKIRMNIMEKDEKDIKILKESKEQEVYIGQIPIITDTGSFIINGIERVIVSQLHRSPGVYFSIDKGKIHTSGRLLYTAKVIPVRGSWLDFEFDSKDILYVKIDKRKKLYATVVLRALGYSDKELLEMFYPVEEIRIKNKATYTRVVSDVLVGMRANFNIVSPKNNEILVKEGAKITKFILKKITESGIKEIPIPMNDIIGRVALSDIIDNSTGEIVLEANKEITEEIFDKIISLKINILNLLFIDNITYLPSFRETLITGKTGSQKDALKLIYQKLRPGEPATEGAANTLFEGLFFDRKRYDLSEVGRMKINRKLGLDIPIETRILTKKDIIEMVRYLLNLRIGKGEIDDIDHLGNRRVRGIGELLENQFRIGLARMGKFVKEKMSNMEIEDMMPNNIINAKPVVSAIKEFFNSSQLSQFMNQTNPLSEITHKRRLSSLGPGGLPREHSGFEVRDVHTTHYGRICPIETPEGPNIGLITSLASYAKINDYGLIESPYRKVLQGNVTKKIEYLTALETEKYIIAEATTPVDKKNNIIHNTVSVRVSGDFRIVPKEDVNYMDVSPAQIVGISASLIPFLENDDANRALMGSNMQRQAVPLIKPDVPIVGTGMEKVAARDSGWLVIADKDGIIETVDSLRIVMRITEKGGGSKIYNLVKFQRSNQGTCINQKPIVKAGDKVQRGDILSDGPSTELGELALGKNVIVAFMTWGGYNFEDAILVNERIVKEDVFTSIHIEEFDMQCRDTKLGPEEITRDIPNIGAGLLKDLDESGIIRIGAEVKAGDILVGKVTPKGESMLTPEEKLLKAIFGDKANEVKESSLYVPPGIDGVVVDVRVLTRKGVGKDQRTKEIEADDIEKLQMDLKEEIKVIKDERSQKLRKLLVGQKISEEIRDPSAKNIICQKNKILTELNIKDVKNNYLHKIKIDNSETMQKIDDINNKTNQNIKLLETLYKEKIDRMNKGDELLSGVNKLIKVYIAMKRKLQVGDKIAGRHGNKGVVSIILPEEEMPYLGDGTPVDIILNPLGVPSRMNVGQILESHLGIAALKLGIYVSTPIFEGAHEKEVKTLLEKAGIHSSGQMKLYDGRTGESFKKLVTVGCMYVLKLHHLISDKIHARSIGPYSLVTQQPLGGKAQFGGQRMGEMEVWALEAYGAANTLQEFLTVKSDDIQYRTKMYDSIIKGVPILETGMPESFHVLIKELQSLCLDVEFLERKTDKEAVS